MENIVKILHLIVVAAATLASASAIANADLAKAKNCLACHAVANKVVGPAFTDVAKKYAGQAGAEAKLVTSITKGSTGTWGPIAMPPNAVSAQEASTLAKWVLAQK